MKNLKAWFEDQELNGLLKKEDFAVVEKTCFLLLGVLAKEIEFLDSLAKENGREQHMIGMENAYSCLKEFIFLDE